MRVRVAEAGEIPRGQVKLVQAPSGPVAVFRLANGEYAAIDDMCPHRAGPLSEGRVEGTTVRCPWHDAVFDVTNGAALTGPTKRGVRCHRVVEESDGSVHLEVDG